VTVISLILVPVPDAVPAATRKRLDGRKPVCSEMVHRAPPVQVTDAGRGALAAVESVETTQVELTVARTANCVSAVWLQAGALEKASTARAVPVMAGGIDLKWRLRVIATRLRRSR